MTKIHYREQDLQIRCVKWFRVTYPQFAYLMFHPKNEEAGGRNRAVRAKKEGVQAGVSDLVFLIPTQEYSFLCIELKNGHKNSQTKEQKRFQRYVEAAGGKYVLARSYDQTVEAVTKYMDDVSCITWGAVNAVSKAIDEELKAEAKRELAKLINKQ
jgi:hypothetical protein